MSDWVEGFTRTLISLVESCAVSLAGLAQVGKIVVSETPVARRIPVIMERHFATRAKGLNRTGLASCGYGLGAAADFLLEFPKAAQKSLF